MKIGFCQTRRFRWINLPGAMLLVLLQRMPALTAGATAEEMVGASPVGMVLKAAVAALGALGAVNTMAGATPLVPSGGSATGITVAAGADVSIFYTVNGTQTPVQSWSVDGSIPPGLNFSGLTAPGAVNVDTLNLAGRPTTAGTYSVTLVAYQFSGADGIPSPSYNYTVTVTGSASVAPTIGTPPASQTVNVGAAVTFSVAVTGTAPFTYQWLKNNSPIASATGATYLIGIAATADAGNYAVAVTNSAGTKTSAAATLTVNQLSQSITFPAPADVTFSAPPFAVGATASSGLPVSFAIVSGPASISGNLVTVTAVGTVTVRATQAGSATYGAAGAVDRSFAVSPATAQVTLANLAATYDGGPHAVTATTSPGGLATSVTYNGTTTAPADAGSYPVVATVTDANYQGSAGGTLVIAKADQTITFANPGDRPFTAAPVPLNATTTAGLAVSFTVTAGPASVDGPALILTGTGLISVSAGQEGDANHAAATPVIRSFTVAPDFSFWQRSMFTAGELANPAISGPGAVYGSDGLPNLLKYALGLDPKQNVTTGLPAVSTTASDWLYTFTRPAVVTDATYAVEVSTDLVNWTTAGVTMELVSSANGIETWRGRVARTSATRLNFRLAVTQP